MSTWLLCASGQGNLLFIHRGKLCSFKKRFKMAFFVRLLFTEINGRFASFFFFLFFFISFSIFSLHRCEGTGLMSLFPSMLLAQNHRVTMPTTGWILILALLVAQQVQLFLPEQGCRGSLFQSHPLFQTSRFGSQVNHLMLCKKNKKNVIFLPKSCFVLTLKDATLI